MTPTSEAEPRIHNPGEFKDGLQFCQHCGLLLATAEPWLSDKPVARLGDSMWKPGPDEAYEMCDPAPERSLIKAPDHAARIMHGLSIGEPQTMEFDTLDDEDIETLRNFILADLPLPGLHVSVTRTDERAVFTLTIVEASQDKIPQTLLGCFRRLVAELTAKHRKPTLVCIPRSAAAALVGEVFAERKMSITMPHLAALQDVERHKSILIIVDSIPVLCTEAHSDPLMLAWKTTPRQALQMVTAEADGFPTVPMIPGVAVADPEALPRWLNGALKQAEEIACKGAHHFFPIPHLWQPSQAKPSRRQKISGELPLVEQFIAQARELELQIRAAVESQGFTATAIKGGTVTLADTHEICRQMRLIFPDFSVDSEPGPEGSTIIKIQRSALVLAGRNHT